MTSSKPILFPRKPSSSAAAAEPQCFLFSSLPRVVETVSPVSPARSHSQPGLDTAEVGTQLMRGLVSKDPIIWPSKSIFADKCLEAEKECLNVQFMKIVFLQNCIDT